MPFLAICLSLDDVEGYQPNRGDDGLPSDVVCDQKNNPGPHCGRGTLDSSPPARDFAGYFMAAFKTAAQRGQPAAIMCARPCTLSPIDPAAAQCRRRRRRRQALPCIVCLPPLTPPPPHTIERKLFAPYPSRCAYNALYGVPACANRVNNEIVRDEWGWEGFFISDCGGQSACTIPPWSALSVSALSLAVCRCNALVHAVTLCACGTRDSAVDLISPIII
eukprot:SAG22_NODE_576_length_8982_cov_21.167736_4_plen_220_part_00